MNKTILLTYPRHGSHKLYYAVKQLSDIDLEKTHHKSDTDESDFIITIARNPIDTIISQITLESYFNTKTVLPEKKDFNSNIKNEDGEIDLEKAVSECKKFYIDFYNKISDTADMIIKYEDLVNDIDMVVESICDKVDANRIDGVFDQSKVVWNEYPFLNQTIFRSSTNYETYEDIKSFVLNSDLTDAILAYENILSKNQ
jgi:hypothetical protein